MLFTLTWIGCLAAVSIRGWFTEIVDERCWVGIGMVTTWVWKVYPSYELFISAVIPIMISVICHVKMLYALRQSAENLKLSNPADTEASNVHNLRMAHMNVFKTCVCVLVVFIFCSLTLESALLLFILGYYTNVYTNHFIVGHICIIVNCCLNPYIYAIRYNDFKTQLRVMLKRKPSTTSETLEFQSSSNKRNESGVSRV